VGANKEFYTDLINQITPSIIYRVLTISELFLNGRSLKYGQFNKVAEDETRKLPKNSETQQDAGKGDKNVHRKEYGTR
jgi:hypothetical protein